MFRYHENTIHPALSKIKNNILVEIGTEDDYILQKNKQDCIDYLERAFKNSRVTGHIIKDANHGYDGKYDELASNVINWIKAK